MTMLMMKLMMKLMMITLLCMKTDKVFYIRPLPHRCTPFGDNFSDHNFSSTVLCGTHCVHVEDTSIKPFP